MSMPTGITSGFSPCRKTSTETASRPPSRTVSCNSSCRRQKPQKQERSNSKPLEGATHLARFHPILLLVFVLAARGSAASAADAVPELLKQVHWGETSQSLLAADARSKALWAAPYRSPRQTGAPAQAIAHH